MQNRQEDDQGTPTEYQEWDSPTPATKHMPHQLTKCHLPYEQDPTNNILGRCTLPLQSGLPAVTFTWGEMIPGTMVLTYLCLRDTEAHASPPLHTTPPQPGRRGRH